MGWSNGESNNTRSRVVRLRFARKLAGVEDIRLKGVDKFSVVTFEMVRAAACGSCPPVLTQPPDSPWTARAPDGLHS